jgi:hypothetical protein
MPAPKKKRKSARAARGDPFARRSVRRVAQELGLARPPGRPPNPYPSLQLTLYIPAPDISILDLFHERRPTAIRLLLRRLSTTHRACLAHLREKTGKSELIQKADDAIARIQAQASALPRTGKKR